MYDFGAAIRIAYGDPNDGDEDGRDGVRSAVKYGYCAAKTTSCIIKVLAVRVPQHPLTQKRPV